MSSTTFAPTRWAKSFSRDPKKPQWQLITVSPGSIRFMNPASIADVPDEESAIVRPWSPRRQRARIPATRSTRTSQKSGSRCPFIGSCSASRTAGCTFDGPGPQSSRSPGASGGIVVVMVVPSSMRRRGRVGGVS